MSDAGADATAKSLSKRNTTKLNKEAEEEEEEKEES